MASATIDVYIKLASGKAFSSPHFPTDTVRKIAENVGKRENIPEKLIRIKYQGKTLDKTKTVGYLGICAETILKVEVIVPKELNISVQFPDGSTHPFLVQTTDRLEDLKRKIECESGIAINSQILQFDNGSVLSVNTCLLCDSGIVNESLLKVKEREIRTNGDDNTEEEKEEIDEEKKQALMDSFATEGKTIEVVFCFDTTGSMYSCIEQVREKLRSSISRLLRDIPRMRIGLMANGDYCDFEKYVVEFVDLTSEVDVLVKFAKDVPQTGGGGNGGECYEWALRKAQQLDWSEDSAKALVMIGDELPHVPSYTDQGLFWKDELDVLSGMGVKVYGVQAMHQHQSDMFYEEMADRTGGYYLRLKNFSLITDMFLAVCYRESNAEQLDAFVEEVQNEGRMTEDTKLFLDKLEKEQTKPEARSEEERGRRYVNAPWWDPTLDNGKVQYKYDSELDSFRPHRQPTDRSSASSTSSTYRSKSRRSRFKHFVLSAFKRK